MFTQFVKNIELVVTPKNNYFRSISKYQAVDRENVPICMVFLVYLYNLKMLVLQANLTFGQICQTGKIPDFPGIYSSVQFNSGCFVYSKQVYPLTYTLYLKIYAHTF